MSEWAPYHVVQTDLPLARCVGRSYRLDIALSLLRFQNRHFPEQAHAIVFDGGILDEAQAEELLNRRATERFKIVRAAA